MQFPCDVVAVGTTSPDFYTLGKTYTAIGRYHRLIEISDHHGDIDIGRGRFASTQFALPVDDPDNPNY